MKNIIECRIGRRCNRPLSCKTCGENWQKGKFKGFCQSLDTFYSTTENQQLPLIYIVIKPLKLGTLTEKSKEFFILMEELRELKKRGKLAPFFGRLEFSYGKTLGFNPHLNLLVWGDYLNIKTICDKLGLGFWKRSKTNDSNTAKNIAWYMLKFNSIGIEKGETVRKLLNRKKKIIHSKDFTLKKIDYIDEIKDIDFSFMGVYPIRSKKAIMLREKRKQLVRACNTEIKEADADFFNTNY